MESMENFTRPLIAGRARRPPTPRSFPNTVYNAAGGQVAMNVGAIGPASTVTAGHARGRLGALLRLRPRRHRSGRRDDLPGRRHADRHRDRRLQGPRPPDRPTGNAAGSRSPRPASASCWSGCPGREARGARIYGEMLGFGIASDGRGVGRFDREGQRRGARHALALERAGLQTGDVRPCGAAPRLPPRGRAEEKAIRRLFGERVPVMSPKLLLGEPMGAGGALNAVARAQGLGRRAAPERLRQGPCW